MFGRFLFFSTLFLFSFTISGAPSLLPDFFYSASRTWTSASGLPHNSVTSLYRDENGLLWAGTVEGLVRIGSNTSEIFSKSTNSAILSNKINSLSGCNGKVFVATPMGISEISGFGKKISKLVEMRGIFDIGTFEDCTLFAASAKEIIMVKSNKITRLSDLSAFPESSLSAVFSDGAELYAGFENGEVRAWGKNGFSENLCAGNSSPVTAGKAKEGRVFAGTAEGTVFEIKNGKCWKIAKTESRKAVTSLDFQGGTAAFVSDGVLFFAENGVVKPCGAFCADAGSVSEVMLDGAFVWLAGSRGVTLFYPGKFMTLGRESGLFSEKVYALVEDDAGRVWTGTRGGGLFVYENGQFRYVRDRKGDIGRFVGGLFQNSDGNILVGTTSGIISFSPEKPNVFKRMKVENNGVMEAVGVIFRDRKSRLWAGGSGGAIYLNTAKGWHLLRKFGDDSDFVSAIAQDNAGNLWFAASQGLWQLDKNDEFHEINQGVAVNVPVSLYVDENDIVLVGSMHRGITLIFPDMKFKQLDSRKGLCSDTILGITADESGNLWFSSTNGIFSIPRNELLAAAQSENARLSCTPFDASDGIRRPESTGGVQPSVLKRKNGDLWFPTLEGVAVLKKDGRKSAKFDSVVPEESAAIIVKNEEKSNYLWIFAVFAGLAAVCVIFVVRRPHPDTRPHPQPGPHPDPLQSGEGEIVGRGENAVSAEQDSAVESGNDDNMPDLQDNSVESECDETGETEETAASEDIFDPATDEVEEKQKYEGYQLDDEIAAAYAKEVKDLMEKEKLYKNPDLTLPMLAKKLKLSANTLSQVLNGYCGQTFYNFVNSYRLEEVVSMMRDPKFDDKSVLELLLEAGFKSKSTFNPIFKKWTGKTPSEYRKEIQEKR